MQKTSFRPDRFIPFGNAFLKPLFHSTVTIMVLLFSLTSEGQNAPVLQSAPAHPSTVIQEMETALWAEVNRFFPGAVDWQYGGFRQCFDQTWKPKEETYRSLVYQARMTWVAAEIAVRRPQQAEPFLKYARHGQRFLEKMWDKEYGGFFWNVSVDGQAQEDLGLDKHAYGIAFAIYALANVHRASGDVMALERAIQAYRWLKHYGKDPEHPGYFEAFARDGSRILAPPPDNPGLTDRIGTPFGYKSMNTHIHLLEAFAALYRQWPNKELQEDLQEMLKLVRERICVSPPGCMHLYFTPDWQAVPGPTSFGHNVETAYLMVEAAELLSKEELERTLPVARSLVDHALQYGYDRERGGIYELGAAFGPVYLNDKVWWSQAEALNAFLLMHEHFGQTDRRYFQAFEQTWSFVRQFVLDHEHGGWRWAVDPEGRPIHETDKATPWKAAYHTGRALLNCIERLEHQQ